MKKLNNFGYIESEDILNAVQSYPTPFYLYDEKMIIERCRNAMAMPNAFGITVRYAMKANSTKAIMQIIDSTGMHFDASSLNEAKRASLAGIALNKILLTTQEVPEGDERKDLEDMMLRGLNYNICSKRQLSLIGDFASSNNIPLSIRMHPGTGAGESATRNTGDDYSCFGVHLSDVEEVLEYAKEKGLIFVRVHTHIGSGGDPELWKSNIDTELGIIESYFPDAKIINLGGGLKEARIIGEKAADITALGQYAKERVEEFAQRTGRKLKLEIEPGTYIMANSGYIVSKVLDKKTTGASGFNFVILDGGMDLNLRPSLYGSKHPLYVIDNGGNLKSSDNIPETVQNASYSAVIVGRCCESGDSQTLNEDHEIDPRAMAEPNIGEYVVVGGAGAYCSSMTPFNYNSHQQSAEVILTEEKDLIEIRKKQTIQQMTENELTFSWKKK